MVFEPRRPEKGGAVSFARGPAMRKPPTEPSQVPSFDFSTLPVFQIDGTIGAGERGVGSFHESSFPASGPRF
jgi:hypothetical protein